MNFVVGAGDNRGLAYCLRRTPTDYRDVLWRNVHAEETEDAASKLALARWLAGESLTSD